jgi:hypothetical protein
VFKRWQWVQITAALRPKGQYPTDTHHLQTRGAHPERITDPTNLIGLSAAEHRAYHDQGTLPPHFPALDELW